MATNTAVTSTTPSILSSPNEKGPYSIGFVYVNQSDVEVYVNGVKKSITTDYTFSSATQITFVANPTVSIEFRRNSDLTTRSVDFNDGSVLTESDLDSNTNQILYAQQEIINDVATKTGTETLTNKTLTSPDINTPDIDGGTIDGATISSCTINNDVTGNLTGNVTGNLTGNVTGNTSGTAATVTGAAQSAITSVGTLTGLTVGGDVIIDGASKDFSIRNGSGVEKFRVDSEDGDTTIQGELVVAGNTVFKGSAQFQGDSNSDLIYIIARLGADLIPYNTNVDLGTSSLRFGGFYGTTVDVTGNITVGGTVDGVDIATRDTLFGGLTSSSGVLTDGVIATTQAASNNSTKIATTAYTDTAIANLVDSSPGTLNTLNELAAALGDDANFSTTVTNSIATKLPLAGGTLTGSLTVSNDLLKISGGGHTKLQIETTGTGHATGIQIKHASGNAAEQTWQIQTDGSADGDLKLRNATAGTDAIVVDPSNNATFSGNVKLGSDSGAATDSYYDDLIIDNSGTASGAAGGTGVTLVSGNNTWGALQFSDSDAEGRGAVKYNHGADAMTILSAGTTAITLDSSQNATFAGNVSINCGSDNTGLQITSTDAGAFASYFDNTGASTIGHSGTDLVLSCDPADSVGSSNIVFQVDGNTEQLRIDSNGDLNLGNNPTNQYGYKLNIQDTSILYAQTASSDGTELKLNLDHGNTVATFGTVSSSHLAFVTANTERLRITSDGNATFEGHINVKGGGTSNKFETTSNGAKVTGQLEITTGSNSFITSANVFKGTASQAGAYIRSATSSAAYPTYANVDDTNTGIHFPGSDVLSFSTGGTDALSLDASQNATFAGDVGVGVTSPEARLHVSDGHDTSANDFDGNVVLAVSKNSATDNYAGIAINSGNAASSFIHFGDTDDSNIGRLDYDHTEDSFKFFTNGNTSASLTISASDNATFAGDVTTGELTVEKTQNSAVDVLIRNNNNTQNAATSKLTIEAGDAANVGAIIRLEQNGAYHDFESDKDGNFTISDNGTTAITLDSSQNVTFAGDVTVSNASPSIALVDTNNNSDYQIKNVDGALAIQDTTNSNANRLIVQADGSVNINGDTTFSGDITTNNISGRNFLQNGDMSIYQKGNTETNNVQAGSAIKPNILNADRWGGWAHAADKYKMQVVTDASSGIYRPSDFKYSTKITSLAATGMGTNGYYTFSQRIEKANIQHLKWRTSDARPITLSFWVKSSVTGTFSTYIMFKHASGNAAICNNYTISSADTWEKKTITFPGYTETGQSDATDSNGWGLEFGFTLGTGTAYQNTANQWTTTAWKIGVTGADDFLSNNAATIQFTGVQLEVGSIATPFEHKTPGDNLRECQRYYYKMVEGNGVGHTNGVYISQGSYYQAALFSTVFSFPTTMRATPTLDYTSGTDYYMIFSNNIADNADSFALTRAHPNGGGFDVTGSVSGTQGHGGSFSTKHSSAKIAFESEL